jgi:hypothetical protein
MGILSRFHSPFASRHSRLTAANPANPLPAQRKNRRGKGWIHVASPPGGLYQDLAFG